MNVDSVYLINLKDDLTDTIESYKLSFSDDQLNELSNIIQWPSNRGMINFLDEKVTESLDNPKKYYIDVLESDSVEFYQFDILMELLKSVNSSNNIKSIDNYLQDNPNLDNVIMGVKCTNPIQLFLFNIKKSNLIKDKSFLLLNFPIISRHVGASKNIAADVKQIDKGLILPTTDSIASICEEVNETGNEHFNVKIYDSYKFDLVFGTKETQIEYARRVIRRFNNMELSITKDNINVKFENQDLDQIISIIRDDDKLLKTFSTFKNNGNRTIAKISKEKVSNVLENLKRYVNNNNRLFDDKNIPTIASDGSIIVNKNSLPTFAALLDNKIINRLLSNEIEIPYYKRHSE